MHVIVTRPFNHTGPGQSDAYVCPRIARQIVRAESGGPAVIEVGDRSPERDFFDVRDMALAYVRAAERGRAGEVYNVATGRPVSIGAILDLLVGMSRVPLKVRSRKGARTVLTGDPSKFRSTTGWVPQIPLPQTLSDLLASERKHR